jgi:O-6-methylguanine DNA methyltransferase
MKYYYEYKNQIGKIYIAEEDNKISNISLSDLEEKNLGIVKETDLIKKAYEELKEYLAGERNGFDLPLNPKGTSFQKKVWNALKQIPYGETRSYGQIAEQIDCPKGYRAVGMANNKNPILIVIPCHRVIGSNGALVGYGAGLPLKEKLLELEKQYLV